MRRMRLHIGLGRRHEAQAEEVVHHAAAEHLVGAGRALEQLPEIGVGEQLARAHRIEVAVVRAVDLRHRVQPQHGDRVQQVAHVERVGGDELRRAGRAHSAARWRWRSPPAPALPAVPSATRDVAGERQHAGDAARRVETLVRVRRGADQRVAVAPTVTVRLALRADRRLHAVDEARSGSRGCRPRDTFGPAEPSVARTRVLPPK